MNISRVLKQNGIFTGLIVATPPDKYETTIQKAFSKIFSLKFFSGEEFKQKLKDAGFEILDFTYNGRIALFTTRKK